MKIRIALAVIALLILPLRPCAAEPFAGEFLTLGAGARAIGMGGAYSALADDASAAYWNPAGLAQVDRTQAAFMHSTLHGLDAYDYFNAAHPIGGGVWSLSWLRVGIDGIQLTSTPNSQPVSSINRPTVRTEGSVSNNAFGLAWGTRAYEDDRFAAYVGLAGKFIFITAPEGVNAFGVGADAAALGAVRLSDAAQLRAAANLQDATQTKIYWNTAPKSGESSHRDMIDQNLKLGLALVHSVPPGENSSFAVAAELNSKYDFEKNFGAEWNLGDALALRLGLMERKSAAETLRDISAGAGFKLGFTGGQSFSVDYAFTSGEIGGSHRLSLAVGL